MGTLQYMSPEQLKGKEVDARSDLFSFGCVLYEMLSGKRAFDGKSAASVIAAILEREPAPLKAAPPLERVVKRALAKDPEQRFQTARDLKAALSWAMEQVPPLTAGSRSRLADCSFSGHSAGDCTGRDWHCTLARHPARGSSADAAECGSRPGGNDRPQYDSSHLARWPTACVSRARRRWQATARHAPAGSGQAHHADGHRRRCRSVLLAG